MLSSSSSLDVVLKGAMQQWAMSLPMVVVLIVGVLFAFARWRRHPKVSLLVILSGGLHMFLILVMPIVWHLLFTAFRPSVTSVQTLSMAVGFLSSGLAAVSSGLLIYAAFTDRPNNGL